MKTRTGLYHLRKIVLLMLFVALKTAAISGLVHAEADTNYLEGITPGPLDGQERWTASNGAMVVDAPDRSILLPAETPPNWASRTFAPSKLSQDVTDDILLNFDVKPAAGNNEDGAALVLAGSARIVFEREEEFGAIYVIDAEDQWRDSGYRFAVLPDTGEAVEWMRLSVWVAPATPSWDLYINNQPILLDVSLPQDAREGDLDFIMRGTVQGDVLLKSVRMFRDTGGLRHADDPYQEDRHRESDANSARSIGLERERTWQIGQVRTPEELRALIQQSHRNRHTSPTSPNLAFTVFSPLEHRTAGDRGGAKETSGGDSGNQNR